MEKLITSPLHPILQIINDHLAKNNIYLEPIFDWYPRTNQTIMNDYVTIVFLINTNKITIYDRRDCTKIITISISNPELLNKIVQTIKCIRR